jgi:Spy/CpxP family protein refolding chaperone
MKKQIVLVASAVLILVAGSWAFADPEGCGACGMRGGSMRGGMQGEGIGPMHHDFMGRVEQLNLDQSQQAAVKDIRLRTKKEMIKKRSDLEIALVELQEVLGKDAVDMKAVEAKLKQVEWLRTAVHLTMIKEQEEIKSKLTAEQLKMLRASQEAGCPMERQGHREQEGHAPMRH